MGPWNRHGLNIQQAWSVITTDMFHQEAQCAKLKSKSKVHEECSADCTWANDICCRSVTHRLLYVRYKHLSHSWPDWSVANERERGHLCLTAVIVCIPNGINPPLKGTSEREQSWSPYYRDIPNPYSQDWPLRGAFWNKGIAGCSW